MYKITIQGEREALFVTDDVGGMIKTYFDDDSIPGDRKLKTDEWSGLKSSIKAIYREKEVDRSKEEKQNMDDIKKKENDYREFRRKEQLKTPEERSKDMRWFNLVRQGFVGDRPASEETLLKVQEIQKKWFEENPYNVICSPALFIPIFPNKNGISIVLGDTIIAAVMNDNKYSLLEEKYAKSYERY